MTYLVGLGWEHTDSSTLDPIYPQPRDGGVKSDGRYSTGGLSLIKPRAQFKWNIVGTKSIFQNLLTQFGVRESTEAKVTIYVPDNDLVLTLYRGWSLQPKID